jgi:hypothetical protein
MNELDLDALNRERDQLREQLEAKTAQVDEMLAHEVEFQGRSFKVGQGLRRRLEAWRKAAEALDELDNISDVSPDFREGCYLGEEAAQVSEAAYVALDRARALDAKGAES